jgi:hypothetical protein
MSQLTCGEFVEMVHGLVRMEMLDVTMREQASEHAARCARCAEIMAEARFLADATEVASNAGRELQAPPAIENALISELRSRNQRLVRFRFLTWAMAGAVAAMLIVGLWISTNRSQGPLKSGPRRSPQSTSPIDAKGPSGPQLGVQPGSQDALGSIGGADFADAGETDDAVGDFVAIPYTEDIGPDDEATVVRVEFTRDSLAQLGFPVDEVHGSDLIRADVLVGQDGWPRGVRLVQ